jgi:hypothetical protein
MRLNPNRDYGGPADPNAYWRRRFIVLLGALDAVTLAAGQSSQVRAFRLLR